MRTLRAKLTLSFLAVSGVAIIAAMVLAGISASRGFRDFIFSVNRESFVARLTDYYAEHGSWEGVGAELGHAAPPPQGFPGPLRDPGRFTLIDEKRAVVLGGPENRPGEVVPVTSLSDFVPIVVEGRTVGWLRAPGDTFSQTRHEAAFLDRVNTTLLAAAAAAAGLALVAGAFLARSLTRPLRDLTHATRAVAEGDFEGRVTVRSRDELGALAQSFNRMSEALAESQRLRRQMTADIAHELRTPLAIILGHLDAIGDGVLTDSGDATRIIRDEAEHLSRLVEDLRTLTRADAGELVLTLRPVDLEDLVRRALAGHQPQAAAKTIKLAAEVEPDLAPMNLDPDRLMQVLSNLLDNALFHTPAGGRVVVRCLATSSGIRMTVQDTGPGIPPEDRERIFDRFYRSDKARRRQDGGSGLGLAIARSIVEAHGGRIWVESPRGEGAAILIDLPRGLPPADKADSADV